MTTLSASAGPRVSGETIHATTVAKDGRAVAITGLSGSGKSDLALRLIDFGFTLVSDDRTLVKREGHCLIASAPQSIAGKLEVRGLGIVEMAHVDNVALALVVELTDVVERLPVENRTRPILGVNLPLVSIDAMTASAPSKVALALEHVGLRV